MVIVIVTAINEFNNHANGKHSCYCVKKTNRFEKHAEKKVVSANHK